MINNPLKTAIESFHTKKILVIGDVMLDMYTFGTISRMSPEAPVPVLKKEKDIYVPGGAANVAHNLLSLGVHAIICGVIGDDENGRLLRDSLKEKSIDTELLFVSKKKPTILKYRLVAGTQQLLRVDEEDISHIHEIDDEIVKHVEKIIEKVEGIILSDYAKGFFSENLAQHIISLAKKHKKLVVADIKPQSKSFFKGVSVVTPNLKESIEMTGEKEIEKIGEALVHDFKTDTIITAGNDGMYIFSKDKTMRHIPAKKIEVFDVSGAGDTAIAVITLALTAGLSLTDAAYLGNYASSVVVQKTGTATLSREELESVLHEEHHVEEVDIVPKLWGYEKWIENNDRYCSKLLFLKKGYQCSLHYHKIKDETFIVTKGHVRLEVGDQIIHMRQGNFQRIPPNTPHRFRGIEDSFIIEVSTHHREDDSYRIEESRKAE